MPSHPFAQLKVLDTGPITNHVNIVRNANGQFAYVTIGGLNEVQVFRTDDFSKVATIPVGKLPHGIWPSGDGTRIYVGLENDDKMTAIDTLTNKVIATVPIGQAPQAVTYVPGAVPDGAGTEGLEPLGIAGMATHINLAPPTKAPSHVQAPTSVSLFDQGLIEILEAAVTGLDPKQHYVLGLVDHADGSGPNPSARKFRDQPGGLGHRQRRRPDPSDHQGRQGGGAALSRDRVGLGRRSWQARAGARAIAR